MKNRVSIAVPCYNGEKYIEDFLRSIEMQDHDNIQVILVDDESSDRTYEILLSWQEKVKGSNIVSEVFKIPHNGQAAAIKEALKHVDGEFLMWADCDDLLLENAISEKVSYLKEHADADMVRCDAEYIDADQGIFLRRAYTQNNLKGEDILPDLLNDRMPCLAGTYMMRTSLFRKMFPDGELTYCSEGQNMQMLIPAAAFSKCGYIDRPGLKYRIHNDSHSNKNRSMRELLNRNEEFRRLKKELLRIAGADSEENLAIVEKTHNERRLQILKNGASKGRKEMLASKDTGAVSGGTNE